ncbi:MAG TPA: hypothetical protein VG897_05940 [Terriglobales bacterium]|nr:hypothetical protein [Terriglobales bacterium]
MKAAKIVARIVVASIAYITGTVVMGMLAPALHLPALKALPGATPQQYFVMLVVCSPLLIVGLLPLASGLKGMWSQRLLAIGALLYVTLGLNTLIEAKIFSTILEGSPFLASAQWLLPSALTAAVLTYRFGEEKQNPVAESSASLLLGWRVFVAWLAFPVIYFLFGMCVAPIVVPYYNTAHDALGLQIPAFSVMIRTQLLRSAFFLAASLPAVLLWTKSRVKLFLALGLAHAMAIGIFQLAQASFMPPVLRVAHSAEITADSFAYAAVLTLLFTRSKRTGPAVQSTAAAAD